MGRGDAAFQNGASAAQTVVPAVKPQVPLPPTHTPKCGPLSAFEGPSLICYCNCLSEAGKGWLRSEAKHKRFCIGKRCKLLNMLPG